MATEGPDWRAEIKGMEKNLQPWPHTSNLRSIMLRHTRREKFEVMKTLLGAEYLVTAKIHGSNIAVEMVCDPVDGWKIIRYRRRKLKLGKSEIERESKNEPVEVRESKDGEELLAAANLNGVPIDPILRRYHARLIAFANTVYPPTGDTSLEILLMHGELHLGDDHPQAVSKSAPNLKGGAATYGAEPFWRPFGTQTVATDGEVVTQWLGDELLAQFSAAELETPELLFRGPLLAAAPALFERLTSHETEGSFVTSVTGDRGFKWKDAAMSESDDEKFAHDAKIGDWTDDQKTAFQTMVGFSAEEMSTLELIDEIFFHGGFDKPKYKVGRGAGGPNHLERVKRMVNPDVLTTLTSHGQTLPTKDAIRALDKAGRKAEIARVVDLICDDLWSEYTRHLDDAVLTPGEQTKLKSHINTWYSAQLFRG